MKASLLKKLDILQDRFEEAAGLRDKIAHLRAMLTGEKPPLPQAAGLMPRAGRHRSHR